MIVYIVIIIKIVTIQTINKYKKYFLISLIPLVLVCFATTTSAVDLFPRISIACEAKAGQLFAFNDGFSLLKKCDGIGRRVVLIGEKGEKGDQGQKRDPGIPGPTGMPGLTGELNPLEVEIFAQQTLTNGQESAVIDTHGRKLLIFHISTKNAENAFRMFTSNDQSDWTAGERISGNIGIGGTNGFVEKTFKITARIINFG